MATPESRVKAQCRKILDAAGAWYFFPEHMGYGRAGIPDIIACIGGRMLAVECKAGKNKVTVLQTRELEAVHAAGGTALVITEDTLHLLQSVVNALKEAGT